MATIESLIRDENKTKAELNADAEIYKKKLEKYYIETYAPALLDYFKYKSLLLEKNLFDAINGIKISGFECAERDAKTDYPYTEISFDKRIFTKYYINDDIFCVEYKNKDILEQIGVFEDMIRNLEQANFLYWESLLRNNLEKTTSKSLKDRKDISEKMDALDSKMKLKYRRR